MAKQITEHKVRALTGRESRYRISEDNLQIEVNPTGRRVWYCQGRANGKRFRKRLGEYPSMSVKAAREAVRKVLHERDQGIRIIDDPSSFEAFVEGDFREWCEANRKQGAETMKRIRNTHIPMLGAKKMRDITQQDVERQKASMLKTKANSTVKRDLGDLRRIFSKAVEWGLLRKSPASSVSDPRVEHAKKLYLTETETERLHDALEEWERLAWEAPKGERQRYNRDLPLLVRLLVNTGLRRNEALSLRWNDINTDESPPTITVRPEIAKSERSRVIPINVQLAEELLSDFSDNPAVFRAEMKKRGEERVFSLKYPAKAWQKLRAMADLEHVTLHHLRHNFASQLVRRGVALHVVSELLGHTDLKTTQIYLSVRTDDKVEAVNLLCDRFG